MAALQALPNQQQNIYYLVYHTETTKETTNRIYLYDR